MVVFSIGYCYEDELCFFFTSYDGKVRFLNVYCDLLYGLSALVEGLGGERRWPGFQGSARELPGIRTLTSQLRYRAHCLGVLLADFFIKYIFPLWFNKAYIIYVSLDIFIHSY